MDMIQQILPWLRRSSPINWAVADQAMISGASFALQIMLARWLPPVEYGSFAIVFSIFFFIAGLYNALIFHPLSVFGAARYKSQLGTYLTALFCGQVVGGVAMLATFGLIAWLLSLRGLSLASSFGGLSCAAPMILFFWFVRRLCYLKGQPKTAALSSTLYSFIMFGGAYLLQFYHSISSFNAFLVIAISSACASLWTCRKLSLSLEQVMRDELLEIARQHWRFGRWLLASSLLYSLSTIVYVPLVAIFSGVEAAGAFRAMQNLTLPVTQVLSALSLLFLPRVSAQWASSGSVDLRGVAYKYGGSFVALAAGYSLLILILAKPIVSIIYYKPFYLEFIWLFPYLAIIAMMDAIIQGISIAVSAAERTDSIFRSRVIGVTVTFLVGVPLLWQWAIHGAAIGYMLSSMAVASVMVFFVQRKVS